MRFFAAALLAATALAVKLGKKEMSEEDMMKTGEDAFAEHIDGKGGKKDGMMSHAEFKAAMDAMVAEGLLDVEEAEAALDTAEEYTETSEDG